MLKIVMVEREGDELDIVRTLFKEYQQELNEDLCFQSFEAELQSPLTKYGDEKGALFLAYWDDEVAGCIALAALKEEGVCEMKRLYVRPAFRHYGIGKELVEALLAIAQSKGFNKMKLDTLKRLQPAIRLYERYGFHETNPYYTNPIGDVVYMEKIL